jgi:hypothetical protein
MIVRQGTALGLCSAFFPTDLDHIDAYPVNYQAHRFGTLGQRGLGMNFSSCKS